MALATCITSFWALPAQAANEFIDDNDDNPDFISLPDACIGQPYSVNVAGSGVADSGEFIFEDGNEADLPPGLALSLEGIIAGTPTSEGEFEFEVYYEDDFAGVGQIFVIIVNTSPCSDPGGGSDLSFNLDLDHYRGRADGAPNELPNTR